MALPASNLLSNYTPAAPKAGFIADFNALLNSTFEQLLTHSSAGFKDIKPVARIIEQQCLPCIFIAGHKVH